MKARVLDILQYLADRLVDAVFHLDGFDREGNRRR